MMFPPPITPHLKAKAVHLLDLIGEITRVLRRDTELSVAEESSPESFSTTRRYLAFV